MRGSSYSSWAAAQETGFFGYPDDEEREDVNADAADFAPVGVNPWPDLSDLEALPY